MEKKLPVAVIILTKDEERHIERCVRNVLQISDEVYVVDSESTDRTCEIAERFGATVVEHPWPGNQAEQFNWALDNLPVRAEWILRLDADEYLLPELVEELREKLPAMPEDVSALSLSLSRCFCGRVLRHGIVNNIRIVRIFRKGKARYERRIMDEHLTILDGRTVEMKHQFIDDNRLPLGEFVIKHNQYASREAALLLDAEYGLSDHAAQAGGHGAEVERKRAQKARYARMPLFWRAFAYFIYRYIVKLGFLDGREGFLWDFLQGWWYRTLVDAKVLEIKRKSGEDREKIIEILSREYGIKL